MLLSAFGCSTATGVQRISGEEAHRMMSELETYILLDVRSISEYEAQHIDGATLIPVNELKNRAGQELPDKDVALIVYCQSGFRSSQAARQLASMGYTNIYDMGSIANWSYGTVQ